MAIARRWSAVGREPNCSGHVKYERILIYIYMYIHIYIYTHINIYDIHIYIYIYLFMYMSMIYTYIYIYIIVSYCLYRVFEFEVYLYHCQVALVGSTMFDRDTPYADPFGIDLSGMDER